MIKIICLCFLLFSNVYASSTYEEGNLENDTYAEPVSLDEGYDEETLDSQEELIETQEAPVEEEPTYPQEEVRVEENKEDPYAYEDSLDEYRKDEYLNEEKQRERQQEMEELRREREDKRLEEENYGSQEDIRDQDNYDDEK